MTPSKEQLQRTFDKVAKHLLKQNKKSLSGGVRCRYRSGELRCAVGCLIPDGRYLPMMEGRDITALLAGWPELRNVPEIDHCDDLLLALQRVHDRREPHEWRDSLGCIAQQHDLSTAVLAEGQ